MNYADNKKKINYIITVLLLSFPIFARYFVFLDLVSVPEVLSFILLIYVLVFRKSNIKLDKSLLQLILFLLVNMLVSLFFYSKEISIQILGTSIRFIYLLIILGVLGYNFFDIELGKKSIILISLILSIYAFIQYLYAKRGIILTTYLPGLNHIETTGIYKNTDDILLEQMNLGLEFRPRSLLNEPAHFATYVISSLTIVLFDNRETKKTYFLIGLILSYACLLSKSSTAIIMMVIIWMIYVYLSIVEGSNRDILVIIFILLSLIILYSYFSGFKTIDYFIVRTFGSSRKLSGIANSSRFGTLSKSFDDFNSIFNVIVGKGNIKVETYLSGLFRLFYNFGLVGALFYFKWIKKSFIRQSRLQKCFIFVFLIMNIGTEIMFGYFMYLYIPFIFYKKSNI